MTRRWTAIIGPLVGIGIFLFATADYWAPLAAPFLPDQRVERASDGFAISFPFDWETADAAEADPDDWWDLEIGDANEYHEKRVADFGLVQLARTRSPLASFEFCQLNDVSAFFGAFMTSLEDAETILIRAREAQPDNITSEAVYFELPAGRTLAVDTLSQSGTQARSYVYLDGETWFDLTCEGDAPAEDRWLWIAETFEFLPVGEE